MRAFVFVLLVVRAAGEELTLEEYKRMHEEYVAMHEAFAAEATKLGASLPTVFGLDDEDFVAMHSASHTVRADDGASSNALPPLAERPRGSPPLAALALPADAPASWRRNYGCVEEFATMPWCDRTLTVSARVELLIDSMSLEEMASQLRARAAPRVERLGVPFFCFGQNVAGLSAMFNEWVPTGDERGYANFRENGASHWSFPRSLGLGATWNITALATYGDALSTASRIGFNTETEESVRGYHCPGSLVIWGPNINLMRDGRWGRAWGTFSSDPLLTARLAVAFVEGAHRGGGSALDLEDGGDDLGENAAKASPSAGPFWRRRAAIPSGSDLQSWAKTNIKAPTSISAEEERMKKFRAKRKRRKAHRAATDAAVKSKRSAALHTQIELQSVEVELQSLDAKKRPEEHALAAARALRGGDGADPRYPSQEEALEAAAAAVRDAEDAAAGAQSAEVDTGTEEHRERDARDAAVAAEEELAEEAVAANAAPAPAPVAVHEAPRFIRTLVTARHWAAYSFERAQDATGAWTMTIEAMRKLMVGQISALPKLYVSSLDGVVGAATENNGRLNIFRQRWNGSNITLCPGTVDTRRGWGLTRGLVKCLGKAINDDVEIAAFFEDDAMPTALGSNFDCLRAKAVPTDAFVIMFGGHNFEYGDTDDVIRGSCRYKHVTRSFGTYGFAVPRASLLALQAGYQTDLQRPERNLAPDTSWFNFATQAGKRIYVTQPHNVYHPAGYSNTWRKQRGMIRDPTEYENTRHGSTSQLTRHDFAAYYAPAFRAVVDAGVDGIMCSYNAVRSFRLPFAS